MKANYRTLRHIESELGSVYKFLDENSKTYCGFGEIYFTTVKYNKIKGWNMHKIAQCNLAVVSGEINFVLAEDINELQTFSFYRLSEKKISSLHIPARTWFSFKGLSRKQNLVVNVINKPHDDEETSKIKFKKEYAKYL